MPQANSYHGNTLEFKSRLLKLGVFSFDLWLPESRSLARVLDQGEQVDGVVFGRYKQTEGAKTGRGLLVATDKRVLLIDKKPMFDKCDEIGYNVVSGVTYTKAGMAGTITLHTRLGDIFIRAFNKTCAVSFVKAIETRIFETKATANQSQA